MPESVKAVIFDFDYTLADSSEGIVDSTRYALRRMGLPAARGDDIRATIGRSLTEVFRSLVDPRHWAHAERFARHFVFRADQIMADRTIVYESVPEVVEALSSRGLSLGIVSTKFRRRIRFILQREGLADRFEVIVGGEDVTDHKPDPAGLLMALGMMERSSSEALYVGDSVVDAETAERAGVRFFAVLSGVTPRAAFRDYEPRAILHDLRDLLTLDLG